MTDEERLNRERDVEIIKAALEDVRYGLLETYGAEKVIANARMPGGHEFFQGEMLDTGEELMIRFSIEIVGASKQ